MESSFSATLTPCKVRAPVREYGQCEFTVGTCPAAPHGCEKARARHRRQGRQRSHRGTAHDKQRHPRSCALSNSFAPLAGHVRGGCAQVATARTTRAGTARSLPQSTPQNNSDARRRHTGAPRQRKRRTGQLKPCCHSLFGECCRGLCACSRSSCRRWRGLPSSTAGRRSTDGRIRHPRSTFLGGRQRVVGVPSLAPGHLAFKWHLPTPATCYLCPRPLLSAPGVAVGVVP